MSWNIFVTAASALMGLAGIGLAAHEPQFDYELAAPSSSSAVITASYQKSPNVSVRFHDSKVGDVLSWLERQNVSFMVADPGLKDREITLSIQDQPLDSVIDSIATALGGHWERKGAIRVFKEGSWGDFGMFQAPNMKILEKGLDGLPPLDMKTLPALPNDQQFQFNYTVPDTKTLQDLEKRMQDFGKLGPGSHRDIVESNGKDREYTFKVRGGSDLETFVKSLSSKQKDLMKSKGYLRIGDLTEEQKSKLGIEGNPEHFEIQYMKDGQTVIVRSK